MTSFAQVLIGRVLTGRDEPPQWRSARRRRIAYAAAWGFWALFAVTSLSALAITGRGNGHGPGNIHDVGWLVAELAVSAMVPVATRYALLAWRIAYLSVLVTPLIPSQSRVDGGLYAVLAITFVVAGLRYGTAALAWMAALTLIPVWVWMGGLAYTAKVTLGLAFLTAALYAAGRRDQIALAAQAREARKQAEEARQQRARSGFLEERARIAREMHDVVAHHMSMIAVQAETAPYRIAGLPESAQAEFATLSQSAREALTDMRRLLGVLRSADEPQRLPQPGLADLPALIESARRAGAQVRSDLPAGDRELPPVVALTAYRIVQESLSNAGRHAPGAPISVVVRESTGHVQVEIANGPSAAVSSAAPAAVSSAAPATVSAAAPAAASSAAPAAASSVVSCTVSAAESSALSSGGHGLAGMRERVALLGGSLRAGPGGGRRIRGAGGAAGGQFMTPAGGGSAGWAELPAGNS